MEIAGARALVTGAGRGIGRSLALRLAAEGASVVAADLDAAAAGETAAASGGTAVAADVTTEAGVAAMLDRAGPGLAILVNNAGGYASPVFPDAPVERWSLHLDLNLRAPMLAIHAAVPVLERRGGGAIVNVASSAGIGLAPYGGPEYAAAKAGLLRLTSTLGPLAARGVHVTCVCPHTVATESVLATIAGLEARGENLPPDLRGPLLPLDEVCDAVVRLIADERLAGRVLFLHGGRVPRLLPDDDPLEA